MAEYLPNVSLSTGLYALNCILNTLNCAWDIKDTSLHIFEWLNTYLSVSALVLSCFIKSGRCWRWWSYSAVREIPEAPMASEICVRVSSAIWMWTHKIAQVDFRRYYQRTPEKENNVLKKNHWTGASKMSSDMAAKLEDLSWFSRTHTQKRSTSFKLSSDLNIWTHLPLPCK